MVEAKLFDEEQGRRDRVCGQSANGWRRFYFRTHHKQQDAVIREAWLEDEDGRAFLKLIADYDLGLYSECFYDGSTKKRRFFTGATRERARGGMQPYDITWSREQMRADIEGRGKLRNAARDEAAREELEARARHMRFDNGLNIDAELDFYCEKYVARRPGPNVGECLYEMLLARDLANESSLAIIVAQGDDATDPLPADAEDITSVYDVLVGASPTTCQRDVRDADETTELEKIDEEKGAAVCQATSLKAAAKASKFAVDVCVSQTEAVRSLSDLALVTEYASRLKDLDYISKNLSCARGTSGAFLRQALAKKVDTEGARFLAVRRECEARPHLDHRNKFKWAAAYCPRAAPRSRRSSNK